MANPYQALVDPPARTAIQAATEASDLGDIEEISGLALGYANINYRVKTTAGIYLARFCRAQPAERILDEVLFLRSVQSSGFPASYPIPRTDGDYITNHQQEKVMVYEFIEGEPGQLSTDCAYQVGQALGCLSLKPLPEGYSSTPLINIEELQKFRSQKSSELKQYPEFREEFLEQTSYIESCFPFDLPRGFVHADAFPDNTIFRDGKLIALIDFEDSAVDDLIFDLGMAIVGFAYREQALDQDLATSLIDGYQGHRALSPDEKQALPDITLWSAHRMAFWHLDHYLETPNDRQKQRIGELQKIVRGLMGQDGETIRTIC